MSSIESTTLEAERAKLTAVVERFEKHYSTYASKIRKSAQVPSLMLSQTAISYELSATNMDIDVCGEKFGTALQEIFLANTQCDSRPGLDHSRKVGRH